MSEGAQANSAVKLGDGSYIVIYIDPLGGPDEEGQYSVRRELTPKTSDIFTLGEFRSSEVAQGRPWLIQIVEAEIEKLTSTKASSDLSSVEGLQKGAAGMSKRERSPKVRESLLTRAIATVFIWSGELSDEN